MTELLSQHREFIQDLQTHPKDSSIKRRYAAWLRRVWGETDQGALIELQAGEYETEHDRRLDEAIEYPRIAELATAERDRIRQALEIPINRTVFQGGFLTHAQIAPQDFAAKAPALFHRAPLLRGVDFLTGIRKDVMHTIAACPELARLTDITFTPSWKQFSEPTYEGRECLRLLAESPHLRPLEKLFIWRADLGEAGPQILAETPALQALDTLHLITTHVGDGGVRTLSRAAFPNLRTLSIERDDITARSISALRSAPFLPQLERLNLSRNTFHQDAVDHLCGLPLTSLTHLKLDYITCTRAGLRQILQSPIARHLKDLKLVENKPNCPDFYDIEDVLPAHLRHLRDPVLRSQTPASSGSATFDPLEPFSIDVNGSTTFAQADPSPSPAPVPRKQRVRLQTPQDFYNEILTEPDDPF